MFLAFSGTPAHNRLIVWVAMRIALWKRGGGGGKEEEGWEELELETNRKERRRERRESRRAREKEEGERGRGQDRSGRCGGEGSKSREMGP